METWRWFCSKRRICCGMERMERCLWQIEWRWWNASETREMEAETHHTDEPFKLLIPQNHVPVRILTYTRHRSNQSARPLALTLHPQHVPLYTFDIRYSSLVSQSSHSNIFSKNPHFFPGITLKTWCSKILTIIQQCFRSSRLRKHLLKPTVYYDEKMLLNHCHICWHYCHHLSQWT